MKKILSMILALSLIAAIPTFALAAEDTSETGSPVVISPFYAYIGTIAYGFDIDSSGLASCDGKVVSFTADSAKLVVTLQQYKDSKWQKHEEWSTTGSVSVILNKTKYVTSGYKYRVVVTATVYDAAGKELETQTITSPEKSF